MATLTDIFNKAGINFSEKTRAMDPGMSQFSTLNDALSSGKTYSSDLTDVLSIGALRGTQDKYYLAALANVGTANNVDADTKAKALRSLSLANKERVSQGLTTIDVPGAGQSNITAPGAAPVKSTATYTGLPPAAIGTPASYGTWGLYNQAKAQYDTALAKYNTDKTAFESNIQNQYDTSMSAYQKQVTDYNMALSIEESKNAALDTAMAGAKKKSLDIAQAYKDQVAAADKIKKEEVIKTTMAGLSRFSTATSVNTISPSSASLSRVILTGGTK